MKEFRRLFKPVTVGAMELKNRLVMPAMSTMLADGVGAVTGRLVDYYVERAKGGVGMVIVEATAVDWPLGKILPVGLRVDDDRFIPGLNQLAEAVRACGAKVALQLAHAGRQTTLAATEGKQPVSASDFEGLGVKARALTTEEVRVLVEKFAEGARRARAAGFDAVEIHGAHGYLIAQFLSPYTNKRGDEYGGSLSGRTRFALEILKQAREKVGEDFSLIMRISADEYIQGGLTLKDTEIIAQKLEQAGVDALNVSAGLRETAQWTHAPMAIHPGYLVHLAEGMKQVVKIPVITVGRINDPALAERILQEGRADLVAMGRALLADPELPRKAAEGRLEDIRKCIACCRGCIQQLLVQNRPVGCTLNAAVGREKELRLRLAVKPKQVVVTGGGPAGMEAARVAALRGHKVILFEKEDRLGGQLILSVKPPHKEEIWNVIRYFENQLRKLGVQVELGRDVDCELVKQMRPDVVVLATGAKPLIPSIPGVDRKNVVTAWGVLKGTWEVAGESIAVVGGGTVGCETAEFIAETGKRVTVVEASNDVAADMPVRARAFLLSRFNEKGISVLTGMEVKEITDRGLTVVDKSGNKQPLEADAVVLALGSTPNNNLNRMLKGLVPEVYEVGDCVEPRNMLDAIHEGYAVACKI